MCSLIAPADSVLLSPLLLAVDLLSFAMLTWVLAPLNIKAKLISHFLSDPSGKYMMGCYLGKNREGWEEPGTAAGAPATQLPAAAAGMLALQQLAAVAVERAG